MQYRFDRYCVSVSAGAAVVSLLVVVVDWLFEFLSSEELAFVVVVVPETESVSDDALCEVVDVDAAVVSVTVLVDTAALCT